MIWLAISVLFAVALLFWTALPLAQGRRAAWDAAAKQRELKAERDRLVERLREAAIDFDVGRIDAAAYATMRATTEAELATVLEQIDQLEASGDSYAGR